MESLKLTYDLPVCRGAAFYLFVREIDRWWPSVFTHDPARYRGLHLDGRVGGVLATRFEDGEMVWGEVMAWGPPRFVAWQQWWRQSATCPSVVTVRFTETDNGSRIHFEHGGWNELNAHQRQRFIEWPLILSHYVEHARAHARTRRSRGASHAA